MKVRLLTGRAGLLNGRPYSQDAGEVIEVESKEGKTLIERGQAEAVRGRPAKDAETADAPAPESE